MILSAIGEDPEREGLKKTPERVAKMYCEICSGYEKNEDDLVNEAIFCEKNDEMIILRNISFYSLCEHHMLPFFGKVSVAYIPNGKIIGLSKIPRIIDMYSQRLQIQERMTMQIANSLEKIINPRGVAVLVEGHHLCSMMRGVKKEDLSLITQSFCGQFHDNLELQKAFLSRISVSEEENK